jgi:hypothetical protein
MMTAKKKKPAKKRPAVSRQAAEPSHPRQQMADDGSNMQGFIQTAAQTEPPPTEG